jgi:hypothetical protein
LSGLSFSKAIENIHIFLNNLINLNNPLVEIIKFQKQESPKVMKVIIHEIWFKNTLVSSIFKELVKIVEILI